jgi:tRNA dimethylallyltransferase
LKNVFYIAGPTAAGKSELAADVAANLDAEIVSADAFQIYRGLDLLTAKPDAATLAKAPHHLLGSVPLEEEMNAEKFRSLALRAIDDMQTRGKNPIVVGGSGLYLKALTHGLSDLPSGNTALRAELNGLTLEELRSRLIQLDPPAPETINLKNRRRVLRALEICLLTGKPVSEQRDKWKAAMSAAGIFVFRDRAELYERINDRVQRMFESGVLEEVRAVKGWSATAAKTIGLSEILELLAGRMSRAQGIAQIQQATRRYAKRQLTWFRGQSSFEPLNLSLLSHRKAVEWITERARRSFAEG